MLAKLTPDVQKIIFPGNLFYPLTWLAFRARLRCLWSVHDAGILAETIWRSKNPDLPIRSHNHALRIY